MQRLADYLQASGSRQEPRNDDDDQNQEPQPSSSSSSSSSSLSSSFSSSTSSSNEDGQLNEPNGREEIPSGSRPIISVDLRNRDRNGQPTVQIISDRIRNESRARLQHLPTSPSPPNFPSHDGMVLLAPNFGQGSRLMGFFGSPRDHRNQFSAKKGKVYKNQTRLTHYIQESNTGQGFIKEVSFSPDGRVICSPYGKAVRLLSFDASCSDLSQNPPQSTEPSLLHEIGELPNQHDNFVLSSAFSPHGMYLVTGCLGGKIVWHQPVL